MIVQVRTEGSTKFCYLTERAVEKPLVGELSFVDFKRISLISSVDMNEPSRLLFLIKFDICHWSSLVWQRGDTIPAVIGLTSILLNRWLSLDTASFGLSDWKPVRTVTALLPIVVLVFDICNACDACVNIRKCFSSEDSCVVVGIACDDCRRERSLLAPFIINSSPVVVCLMS